MHNLRVDYGIIKNKYIDDSKIPKPYGWGEYANKEPDKKVKKEAKPCLK